VVDAAAMERKAHMRAPVVKRDHVVGLSHDKYRAAWRTHDHSMAVAQLLERTRPNETADRFSHVNVPVTLRGSHMAANAWKLRSSDPDATSRPTNN
jgi:hypothetical protein